MCAAVVGNEVFKRILDANTFSMTPSPLVPIDLPFPAPSCLHVTQEARPPPRRSLRPRLDRRARRARERVSARSDRDRVLAGGSTWPVTADKHRVGGARRSARGRGHSAI